MLDVPFILVGNKLDLATQEPQNYIDAPEAEKVEKELGGQAALQCSAQQEAMGGSGNVDRVFKTAIKVGLENQQLPEPEPIGCLSGCTLL